MCSSGVDKITGFCCSSSLILSFEAVYIFWKPLTTKTGLQWVFCALRILRFHVGGTVHVALGSVLISDWLTLTGPLDDSSFTRKFKNFRWLVGSRILLRWRFIFTGGCLVCRFKNSTFHITWELHENLRENDRQDCFKRFLDDLRKNDGWYKGRSTLGK